MLLKLECFQYATSLDPNMGYYHMRLSKEESNVCTIILTWLKYKCKRLPVGVCNSLDIFQDKINKMFREIELIRAYIGEILVITKFYWSDPLDKLELVIKKLRAKRLGCNIENSYFGQTKMKYLGFRVTRTGIRPINKKIEAIVNMTPSKNQKQVRSFIGLVN